MATFREGPFGNFSGRMGSIVIRKHGDTTIAYPFTQPEKSYSEPSVKTRNRFQFVEALSKALNQTFIIKHLWKISDIPGKAVNNKQQKINGRLVKSRQDLNKMVLVPAETYFQAEMESCSFEGDTLIVTAASLVSLTGRMYTSISAQGILCLSDPKQQEIPEFAVLPLSSSLSEFSFNDGLTFHLPVIDREYLSDYAVRQFVINLITYYQNGDAAVVSVNFYAEVS